MTQQPPHQPDDAEVMGELRAALGFGDPVPEETLEMVMTGYDIVNLDVVLADLVNDTASGTTVPVRADDGDARHMVFESGGHRVSIAISRRAPQVVGRVEPSPIGAVTLDQPGNPSIVGASGGAFEFTINPAVPFRLRWTTASGAAAGTDWIE